MSKRLRVLILDAPLGGGHRSISEAIIEALEDREQVEVIRHELRSVSAEYLYQFSVKHLRQLSNSMYRALNVLPIDSLSKLNKLYEYSQTEEVVMDINPDLVISNMVPTSITVPKIIDRNKLKCKCVVFAADPFSPHRGFFNPYADHVCVASTASYTLARKYKIPSEKLSITGHPIRRQFYASHKTKQQLRNKLGWHERLFTVLVGGSGEGGDKVEEILEQIHDRGLKRIQVACMTGRNEKLYANLMRHKERYNFPLLPYEFIDNPADLLHASDVVMAKAGPNILFEAIAAGKPFVPTHHMEQESGNLDYIKSAGVGMLKNRSYSFADIIADIQSDETLQEQLHHNINRVRTEHKDAAERIAEVVLGSRK